MCFRKKQEPVRLRKEEEKIQFLNDIKTFLKDIKPIIFNKNMLIIIYFIIIFCIIIGFALHESTTYFVYNRGGI